MPEEKKVLALDSKAGDFLKPTVFFPFERWVHSYLAWITVLTWLTGYSIQTEKKTFHNSRTSRTVDTVDLSLFQVFHILRDCLNIFKKKMFSNNYTNQLQIAIVRHCFNNLTWIVLNSCEGTIHWLLISQLTLFWKDKQHGTVRVDNFCRNVRTVIIRVMALESWSIACFKLYFWNIFF